MSVAPTSELMKHYGGRIRLRVMGIYLNNDKLLLIKHKGFGTEGYLWAPPGGGVEFGEPIKQALTREFFEETRLHIEVQRFLLLNEYIEDPLHAVELFFSVKKKSGSLRLGSEYKHSGARILEEARYFTIEELQSLPREGLHAKLHDLKNFYSLFTDRSCR